MTFATDQSTFTPFLCDIIAITNAVNAVVTFSQNHNFTVGEYISLRVSQPYGMFQANNLRGLVLAITPTTVTTDINTSTFDAFVYPPVGIVEYVAVAVPAGSGIIPNVYPAETNLQDCFDNVPLT